MKKIFLPIFMAIVLVFTCSVTASEFSSAASDTKSNGTYAGKFPSLPNGISAKAIEYAWPYGTEEDIYLYPDGKATEAFNKGIKAAYGNRTNWQQASKVGASCDVFVGTVLRNSYDTEYSPYLEKQIPYLADSDKYTQIATKSNYNKSLLKPGDIIVFSRSSSAHTCICVDISGVLYVAEASYSKSFGHINKLQNYKMSNYKRFEVYRAKNKCLGALAKGQYSTNVKYLQDFLNWAGFDCGEADGAFGTDTETAVKNFQKAVGLTADGKFGSQSLAEAKKYKKNQVKKQTVSYNPYRYADAGRETALRSGSGTSYSVIATIPKGTRLLTYGYDKYNGTDAWYKVKYGNKTGYATWNDVKLSYQAYSPVKKGKTTANLYMRSGVSTTYSKVKYIKSGSTLTLQGYYRMYGADWYKVTYGGKTGYVSSKYVKRIEGSEKKTVSYNPYRYADAGRETALRSGSGTSYSVIATIPKGTRLLTYGYDKYNGTDAWYKVKYGNKTGYATWNDVKLSYQAYSPVKKGKTTANLYMRSGVSTTYSKVKYIKSGSTLTLQGYYRMYGADWYKVTYGGKTGYVSSKYVKRL